MALMRSLGRLARYAPKAKQLAEGNAGKIAENVNKATDVVDEKTKGRYTDKLEKVSAKANDFAAQQGQAPAGGDGSADSASEGPGSSDEPSGTGTGTDASDGDDESDGDRKGG